MKESLRIAIYSRKSKYSEKGESVGNQIELAKSYIKSHYPNDEYDVEIVIFEDEGFSGGNIDRPNFKKFLIEEENKPFDILICYRLDRISRNIADFSNLMNKITNLGTSFISIKEQFDTKTPMGRAMMYIASVFAQLEREVIAERIRDNMIELAKTGRWLGGPAPLGFTSKRISLMDIYEENTEGEIEKKKKSASKLVEVEEEFKIIRLIYEKFLEIKSLNKLESYFLQNKIHTRNGIDFSVSTLRAILTNPIYSANDRDILEYLNAKCIQVYAEGERAKFDGKFGLMGYGKKDANHDKEMKDWIISVGLHKPAVSGITWIQVQELLEKNKEKRYRANQKHDFLFSGILHCKECGSYMRPKISEGERFYYTCELKEKSRGKRCQGKNITGQTLDKLVIQRLKEMLVPSSEICKELEKMTIAKDKNSKKEKQEELEKELKRNNEEIQNLVNKLKYMDMEVVDFVNTELKKLKDRNNQIQNELENMESNDISNIENEESMIASIVLNVMENYFEKFDELDLKSKKDILRILIEDMRGNGKEVEINLLNTRISESNKRLFLDSRVGKSIKNDSKVVSRSGVQFP